MALSPDERKRLDAALEEGRLSLNRETLRADLIEQLGNEFHTTIGIEQAVDRLIDLIERRWTLVPR